MSRNIFYTDVGLGTPEAARIHEWLDERGWGKISQDHHVWHDYYDTDDAMYMVIVVTFVNPNKAMQFKLAWSDSITHHCRKD